MAEGARLQQQLTNRMHERARAVGMVPDRYDPDFFLGVIIEWLAENDAALTGTGVRRFRRGR